MTQIFVDHQILAEVAGSTDDIITESDDYRQFLDDIREEVETLDRRYCQVITLYYFECRTIEEIAAGMNLSENEIRLLIREALTMLKFRLAGLMKARYPHKFNDTPDCPICKHPQRELIDKIISRKKPYQSWGAINSKLIKKIGRAFNPPRYLINHRKYHMKG